VCVTTGVLAERGQLVTVASCFPHPGGTLILAHKAHPVGFFTVEHGAHPEVGFSCWDESDCGSDVLAKVFGVFEQESGGFVVVVEFSAGWFVGVAVVANFLPTDGVHFSFPPFFASEQKQYPDTSYF